MAKFAVLFLAALAFQAAFAGVHRYLPYQENTLGDYEYGLKGYGTGELDNLFDQFQTVTHDLTVYFQKPLPNDRLVIRFITYQSHELAQYIDMVIHKLQLEANNYSGEVNIVLQQIISEFREIQTGFLQVAHYTEVYGVSQLKNHFYTYFQNTIVQIEKLMHLVQTDFEHTHGEFHMIVKNVIADFLYVFQNIYTHVQYFGVYGEQTTPMQLAMQIEEVTKSLTGYLHGLDYSQIQQFRYALHEYVQHVEVIIYRLQALEGTIGHLEIGTVFQQISSKLHRVRVPLMQFIEAEHIENFEFVRSQLIKEFLFVAEEFEELVQYVQIGSQQTFIYEVLGDYLYALHQFRHHMQSGYHGGYYGLYQGGFYGKTGYQGLYKYGGYLGQYYGDKYYGDKYYGGKYYGGKYYGSKYYGGKYGHYYGLEGHQFVDSPKELVNQIQYFASDLSATLQNPMVYNQQYAQGLSVHVREFAHIIKNIVEQLESYEHVDTVIQQVIYKLREVQLHLQQLAAYNVFTNVHQLKADFDNYIQIAVAQIEKLVLIAHEETQGDYYYVVKSVLNLFFKGLYDIHYQMQEVAQYGMGYGQQYRQGYGYGKYDQQYGQGYGFGKYGQYYGQGYGFGKYGQYYGQGYGFGKYGQHYGQGYGFDKYGQHYGQGYGFGKYGQHYGQGYGFGTYGEHYGQGYGLGKYGQGYAVQGLEQYGKGYGYGYQNTNGYQYAPFGKYFQTYQNAIHAY